MIFQLSSDTCLGNGASMFERIKLREERVQTNCWISVNNKQEVHRDSEGGVEAGKQKLRRRIVVHLEY